MKRTFATLLFTSATLLSATASADAPPWVDRHVVPNADVAGSIDLGFGIGSRDNFPGRATGVGFNLEGAISFARRIEIGLRTGIRAPDEGRYAQADSFARPFDGNTLYDWSNGGSTFANPEIRVRGKLVETRVFELALEGRAYLPVDSTPVGDRFATLFSVPMQIHKGIFRADINPGFVVGFYEPARRGTRFVLSVPVNLWFQVTRKVWLGPLAGFRAYDRDYYGNGAFDLILGFGLGVSVTPFLDIKTQLLFPRINDSAEWFGAGVALGFVFDPN